MAQQVYAGQNVRAIAVLRNAGEAPGRFVLTGRILYKNGAHAGWFTVTPTDYCSVAPPTGFNEAALSLQPGQEAQVTMHKVNWACGKDDAFDDYQLFDVVWELRCLETGQAVVRKDVDALQHRRRVVPPPYPSIAGVSLSKTSVYAGDWISASVSVKNTGGKAGTFRLRGTIYYYGGYHDGAYAGRFTKYNKDYCSASKEPDWDYVDAALQPGEARMLTMYKANIACGNNTAFDSGQRFRCVFELTCLDTGVTAPYTVYFTYYRR